MMSVHLLGVPALVPAGGLLPAGPAGAVPAVTAGTVVPAHPAVVAPAAQHAQTVLAAGVLDGVPVSVTLLRLVLLTALAVVAGTGLVRVVAGPPARAERVVAGVAALAATCAAVAAVTWSGSGSPLWTLALVAASAAVPVLLSTGRPVVAAVPAAVVAALLAVLLGSARGTTAAAVLDGAYAVVAAVLAGAAVYLFARRTSDGAAPAPVPDAGAEGGADADRDLSALAERRTARVRAVAVVTGVLAAGLGLAQLLVTGPFSAIDLAGTGYGRAALAAVVAPVAVTVLVLLERLTGRATGSGGAARARAAAVRERGRTAAAVLAAAGIGAASLLAALPTPAPGAEPGRLLARDLDLGAGAITLVVTPMRPGPNLVQLTGPGVTTPAPRPGAAPAPVTATTADTGHGEPAPVGGTGFDVLVGDREVPFTTRTGAPGGWALVDIPADTGSLTVRSAAGSRVVPIDVGSERDAPAGATGADGPECASAVLGAIVAGGPEAGDVVDCPSESLRPQDEQTLRSTVRALATQGAPGIAIAADASPRSRAAADAVRAEATATGLPLLPETGADGALVVVSGWQGAAGSIADVTVAATTEPTALGGTYLAPWLLTGDVLQNAQSALLPLSFGPQEPLPQLYVRSLAATAPGSAPSMSGLLAWADGSGEQVETTPSLFGAAPVQVPMTSDPMGHDMTNDAAWYPGGAIVQIGGPLDGAPPAGVPAPPAVP